MSLVSTLGKQMLSDLLSRGFRHRRFDLDKLASVARQAGNAAFAELLGEVGRDMDSQTGIFRILQHAGSALAPACRKKAAVNICMELGHRGRASAGRRAQPRRPRADAPMQPVLRGLPGRVQRRRVRGRSPPRGDRTAPARGAPRRTLPGGGCRRRAFPLCRGTAGSRQGQRRYVLPRVHERHDRGPAAGAQPGGVRECRSGARRSGRP